MIPTDGLETDVSSLILWKMLPCTFAFKSFCGHMFSFTWVDIPRSGIVGPYGKCLVGSSMLGYESFRDAWQARKPGKAGFQKLGIVTIVYIKILLFLLSFNHDSSKIIVFFTGNKSLLWAVLLESQIIPKSLQPWKTWLPTVRVKILRASSHLAHLNTGKGFF